MINNETNRFGVRILSAVMAALFLTMALPVHAGESPDAAGPNRMSAALQTLNGTALIDDIISSVDGGLVRKHLQQLQDYKTRYSLRGDRCYRAADYIGSVFEQNGLDLTYDDFPYSTYTLRNIVGERTGKTSPDNIIIICAHYDSTSSLAWSNAPGADDNGSGTAAVLAIAETLSDYDFNCTIRFIAFSGEEQGLKGSFHYVEEALAAGENISAVLNMDMIGHNPDPGLPLVCLYTGAVAPAPLIGEVINTTLLHPKIGLQVIEDGSTGGSDHYPFSSYYSAIMLAEYYFSPYYHRTTDTIDKLNMTYCANVTQIILATAARLAGILPGDISPPTLSPGSPRNNGYAPGLPTISIEVTDPSPLNLTALDMRVNGSTIAPTLTAISQGYNVSYVPLMPLPDGMVVNVSLYVKDIGGNAASRSWSFAVDGIPPQPPTNFTIKAIGVELVKQELTMDIGTTFDSMHVLAPSLVIRDNQYKMWYMACNSSIYNICYANSTDGVAWNSWNKQGVVLSKGLIGEPDGYSAGYPSVIFDGEYKMWYSGFDGLNWRILYANSSDGIQWTKHGTVLDVGTAGEMDSAWATYPCVVKTTEYEMWYMGFDRVCYRYLYANSSDGLTWNKNPADITPDGSGKRYGDGVASGLEVVYYDGLYYMYYGNDDGAHTRTICASSYDGFHWNDLGLAIDVSESYEYDFMKADHCSILMTASETRAYYSSYDGNWRIMMANITPQDPAMDLGLSWIPSSSSDVVDYELFRESRPAQFKYPLERARLEYYNPPADITSWTFEPAAASNISVYGPTTGSDPTFFYLPEDNILDLTLYMRTGTGEWVELASDYDYWADMGQGFVQILSGDIVPGSTIFAWYNYSAGRALRTAGSALWDVRAGSATWASYYYVIRAVDRAGNIAQCQYMVGKIGADLGTWWSLLGNPFLEGPTPVAEVLDGLDWGVARTWEPARWPHQWTKALPGRTGPLNTLGNISPSTGFWVRLETSGIYSECGRVSDITINLTAGWNLVSYPYHDIKSVSDALAGIPRDHVEIFSPAEPGMLLEMGENDQLYPGIGLWIHATSDCVWNAVNVP